MEIIEKICRVICEADGVDPDRESIGVGALIPKDQPYKLWEARKKVAIKLVESGLIVNNDD